MKDTSDQKKSRKRKHDKHVSSAGGGTGTSTEPGSSTSISNQRRNSNGPFEYLEAVEMCGNHLHMFQKIMLRKEKFLEKRPEIRIRSDIFDHDPMDQADPEVQSRLQILRETAVNQLHSSAHQLQTSVGISSDTGGGSLNTQFHNAFRITDHLAEKLLQLIVGVGDTVIPGSFKPKGDYKLDYKTMSAYMDAFLSVVEIESRIDKQWFTATRILKYRIGRILHNSSSWPSDAFIMNYSKNIQPERFQEYANALDFVNCSPMQIRCAAFDHFQLGVDGFKRLIVPLKRTFQATSTPTPTPSTPKLSCSGDTVNPQVSYIPNPHTETLQVTSIANKPNSNLQVTSIPNTPKSNVQVTSKPHTPNANLQVTSLPKTPNSNPTVSTTPSNTSNTQDKCVTPQANVDAKLPLIVKKYKNKPKKRVMGVSNDSLVNSGSVGYSAPDPANFSTFGNYQPGNLFPYIPMMWTNPNTMAMAAQGASNGHNVHPNVMTMHYPVAPWLYPGVPMAHHQPLIRPPAWPPTQ